MTAKQLRQFIIKNKTDCALLIGNGINRRAETGCSWDTLLKALAKVYCPKLCFEQLPTGISNTEFFDLLEITSIKDTPAFDEEQFRRQMVEISKIYKSLPDISESIQKFALKNPPKISDLDKHRSLHERQKEAFTTLSKTIDLGLAMALTSMGDNKLRAILRRKFISSICAYMKNWTSQPIHKKVASFAQKYKLPILTTNYDTLLEDSVGAREHNYGNKSFSDLFPVSLCYTNDNVPNYNNFGIWHINGVIHYPKSILIGLSHYMRSIENIRKLLLPRNKFDVEIIQSQFSSALNDTWINLVLSKHLIVLGLSLDKDETLLRWLLLERAKLYAMFPYFEKKGYYVISTLDTIEPGKEIFLKSIGFEIVQVPDYDSIYKIVSV